MKNEKVIKAISIGLSAVMASSSMSVTAFAAEETTQPVEINVTEESSESSETTAPKVDAANESVTSEASEMSDNVSALVAMNITEKSDGELSKECGVFSESVQAASAALEDANEATADGNDAIAEAVKQENISDKAFSEYNTAVSTAVEKSKSVSDKVDAVETEINNASIAIDRAISVAEVNAIVAEANAKYELAAKECGELETEYAKAKDDYEKAIEAMQSADTERAKAYEKAQKAYEKASKNLDAAEEKLDNAATAAEKIQKNAEAKLDEVEGKTKDELKTQREADSKALAEAKAKSDAASDARDEAWTAYQDASKTEAGFRTTYNNLNSELTSARSDRDGLKEITAEKAAEYNAAKDAYNAAKAQGAANTAELKAVRDEKKKAYDDAAAEQKEAQKIVDEKKAAVNEAKAKLDEAKGKTAELKADYENKLEIYKGADGNGGLKAVTANAQAAYNQSKENYFVICNKDSFGELVSDAKQASDDISAAKEEITEIKDQIAEIEYKSADDIAAEKSRELGALKEALEEAEAKYQAALDKKAEIDEKLTDLFGLSQSKIGLINAMVPSQAIEKDNKKANAPTVEAVEAAADDFVFVLPGVEAVQAAPLAQTPAAVQVANINAQAEVAQDAPVAVENATPASEDVLNLEAQKAPLAAFGDEAVDTVDAQTKSSMNWWWSVVVLALGAPGVALYKKSQKKKADK